MWQDNSFLSSYWHCWDQLFLQNGLLMKSSNVSQNNVVIPQRFIDVAIRNLHSNSSGGHMGVNRTVSKAREWFFWPQMQESVQLFIQNFPECNQIKDNHRFTKAPLQSIRVSEPFVFWAMNYMGPIKETDHGNKHILELMDHFTKCVKHSQLRTRKLRL